MGIMELKLSSDIVCHFIIARNRWTKFAQTLDVPSRIRWSFSFSPKEKQSNQWDP